MTSLVDVLQLLQTRPHVYKIVLEERPLKYMFGAKNYGEIPGLTNASDGDPWDVLVPGLSRRLPTGHPHVVKRVLGIFLLENGNHKICVSIYGTNFDAARAAEEIKKYVDQYCFFTKRRGFYIDYDAFMGHATS